MKIAESMRNRERPRLAERLCGVSIDVSAFDIHLAHRNPFWSSFGIFPTEVTDAYLAL